MENVKRFSDSASCRGDSDYSTELVQLTKTKRTAEGEEILIIDVDVLNKVLGNPEYKDYYVAIYTIAGPTRTGKSFLLSLLWNYLQRATTGQTISYNEWSNNVETIQKIFEWKRGPKSCTRGIHVLKQPFVFSFEEKKIALFLADTQGIFDHNTSERNQAFLGTFSFFLSSFLVFNSLNRIDPAHLEAVYKFDSNLRCKDESFIVEQGSLMFVVRDWICGESDDDSPDGDDDEEDFSYGMDGGKKYFNAIIREASPNKAKEHQYMLEYLDHAFGNNIPCCLLPHPGNVVNSRKPNSLSELDSNFLQASFKLFQEFGNGRKLKIKKINNNLCKCRELCESIKDYVSQFGADLDVSDRDSFLEKDTRVKMSQGVRICVENFIASSRKNVRWDDPNETLATSLNNLKEEMKSVFRSNAGKSYPERVVDEWEKELDRVLAQAIRNLMTCIHVEKAYKRAVIEYNDWIQDDVIRNAEDFGSQARAMRDSLVKNMEASIRQQTDDNDLENIVSQCKDYFKQHTNKITAGIDDDIKDFLKKMLVAEIAINVLSIDLGVLIASKLWPSVIGEVSQKSIILPPKDTFVAKATVTSIELPPAQRLVKQGINALGSSWGFAQKLGNLLKEGAKSLVGTKYQNDIRGSITAHDYHLSFAMEHYKDGEMMVELSFGTLTFKLKVRENLENNSSQPTSSQV